jgi:hypothetical protein
LRIYLIGFAAVLFVSAANSKNLKPTNDSFSCVFDKFYGVDIFKNRKPLTGEAFLRSSSIVTIKNGKTSAGTASLNGSQRGTNAEFWYLVNENDMYTSYVSDDAEIVTVKKSKADSKNGKSYTAAYQYTFLYGYTYEGVCFYD